MKAKDIEPGEVYAVQEIRGRVLGFDIVPFLIARVEKSPVRRAIGAGTYGGDTRVYGQLLHPKTLQPYATEHEVSRALAKVIGRWDAQAFERQEESRLQQQETDRGDEALSVRIINRLSDLGIGSTYSKKGLLIARSSLDAMASFLGIAGDEK